MPHRNFTKRIPHCAPHNFAARPSCWEGLLNYSIHHPLPTPNERTSLRFSLNLMTIYFPRLRLPPQCGGGAQVERKSITCNTLWLFCTPSRIEELVPETCLGLTWLVLWLGGEIRFQMHLPPPPPPGKTRSQTASRSPWKYEENFYGRRMFTFLPLPYILYSEHSIQLLVRALSEHNGSLAEVVDVKLGWKRNCRIELESFLGRGKAKSASVEFVVEGFEGGGLRMLY